MEKKEEKKEVYPLKDTWAFWESHKFQFGIK
jgi:hypothetical protein